MASMSLFVNVYQRAHVPSKLYIRIKRDASPVTPKAWKLWVKHRRTLKNVPVFFMTRVPSGVSKHGWKMNHLVQCFFHIQYTYIYICIYTVYSIYTQYICIFIYIYTVSMYIYIWVNYSNSLI
jgi:hypothetical protein